MSKADNLTDFLTDIADTIRAKKGTTELINPQNFSEEINSLGGSGDNRSNYKDAIDETGSAQYLFYCSGIADASKYIKYEDTSNVKSMQGMFYNCSKLKIVPLLDTRKVVNIIAMFYTCKALEIIPAFDIRNVDQYASSNFVKDCKALTEIWIKNIKYPLTVGSGTSYGHLLTVDSLVHLCCQLVKGNTTIKKLTIGSANLSKLNSVYVKLIDITDEMRAEDDLIDSKLPCVVCESTDEGAMLITEYVQSKHWSLA